MLELIVGIVLGAAFHEFWIDLLNKMKSKINQWMEPSDVKSGDTMDGEVVQEPKGEPAKS